MQFKIYPSSCPTWIILVLVSHCHRYPIHNMAALEIYYHSGFISARTKTDTILVSE